MPDRRAHRGPHPEDAELFGAAAVPALREATSDLCWLLSKGFAGASSLKLVGDRYRLAARQRVAVARCACSDAERARRAEHEVRTGKGDESNLCEAPSGPSRGKLDSSSFPSLWLDGYNVLTTVEAALAGAVVLRARDGTLRDMASMHGSFRKVAETQPALEVLGQTLAGLGPAECVWYLDRPVSNSGRLKWTIDQTAAARAWPWRVELVADPDPVLWGCGEMVATADSAILDRCRAWLNLARIAVEGHVPDAWVIEL